MAKETLVANKDALVDYIASTMTANGTKITKKLAGQVFDTLFEGIEVSLSSGIPVRVNGYLDLSIKATDARTARNPQNGAPVEVPAGHKVHARPMARLKAAVATL